MKWQPVNLKILILKKKAYCSEKSTGFIDLRADEGSDTF